MQEAIGPTERLVREPPPRPAEPAASLADILDRVLHLGVALNGDVTISVAGVDLLYLDLRVLLAAVDTIWPEGRPEIPPGRLGKPTLSTAPPPAPPVAPVPSISSSPPGLAGPGVRRGGTEAKASPTSGLVRLVLTLVRLLHDVLERQAVRRMSAGRLTETQIENVGLALLAQTHELERLRQQFGFTDRELDLSLNLAERFSAGGSPCPASNR